MKNTIFKIISLLIWVPLFSSCGKTEQPLPTDSFVVRKAVHPNHQIVCVCSCSTTAENTKYSGRQNLDKKMC